MFKKIKDDLGVQVDLAKTQMNVIDQKGQDPLFASWVLRKNAFLGWLMASIFLFFLTLWHFSWWQVGLLWPLVGYWVLRHLSVILRVILGGNK